MMSPEKKIKSLLFVIAFLFITNIVLLAFLVFSGDEHSNEKDKRSVIETFLQDQMGFDNEQMAIYQNMRKADYEIRKPIFDSLKSAKNKFYKNIYSDSTADSTLNVSATLAGKRQVIVDKHMLLYFKKVRRICTPGQLPKFDSSFKAVVEKITSGRFRTQSHR